MTEQARVELIAWNRLHTRNLTVPPDLLGQSHVFAFDGHGIDISLPSADRLARFKEATEGTFVDDRISVRGWRMHDGQRQPLAIEVYDVDVVVSIPGRTSVPQEARTTPITHEFFSERQREHLLRLATKYGNVARSAFDLWIRTLRWKADDHRIGLPELSGFDTGWATEILEKGTQNRFIARTIHITAQFEVPVTADVWNKVSAALNTGESPPIYYDLLYDARAHLGRGDLRRTIIDAAVAAETYMRTEVQEGLPADLDASLRKFINDANIRPVVEQFFPERLDTEQGKAYKTIKSNLHRLFDDRNKIMHSGQKEGLTASYCQRIIRSVHELLSL